MPIRISALFTSIIFSASAATQGVDLPARFVADRVFVEPVTRDGKTLHMYTDSGGGANMLCRDAASRLGLVTTPAPADEELGENVAYAHFPVFQARSGIPANADGDDRWLVHDCKTGTIWDELGDGFLSNRWFAGRIWTWNYPKQQLRLEAPNWKAAKAAARVPLGFPINAKGERADNFARITIRVDGKPIDMLLDTGATTTLTPEAVTALSDNLPATRATSMIVDAQFQAWHRAHTDWRVIEQAQAGSKASMIEVPDVEIAGAHVGPLWFTWRPDKNFHEFMSNMMDKQVEGAIGGNAFSHFVMTIDYPRAVAYFRCTRDCKATPRSAP